MVHSSHYDDPYNYFRRLESYSSPRPKSFSRPSSYADSEKRSWSPTKSQYDDDSRSASPTKHEYAYDSRSGSPIKHQYAYDSRSTSPTKSQFDYDSRRNSVADAGATHNARAPLYEPPQGFPYHDSEPSIYDSEKSPSRLPRKSYSQYTPASNPKPWWVRKRKLLIILAISVLLLIGIIVIVATQVRKSSSYDYTPSDAQVTNRTSFGTGGATYMSPNNTYDGRGQGQDRYVYYSGGPQNFPMSSTWMSFENMWQENLPNIRTSCSANDYGPDNTDSQIGDMYIAIQDRANASLVDHRFILAIILQESNGCVHAGSTSSHGGVRNPGLMQSHNGDTFSQAHQAISIMAMIQDGTQGTEHGDGLVQNLNRYGNPYSAARGYNSGYIAGDGDLSDGLGATDCYVSDVANRLTGWVNAMSTCPGDQGR